MKERENPEIGEITLEALDRIERGTEPVPRGRQGREHRIQEEMRRIEPRPPREVRDPRSELEPPHGGFWNPFPVLQHDDRAAAGTARRFDRQGQLIIVRREGVEDRSLPELLRQSGQKLRLRRVEGYGRTELRADHAGGPQERFSFVIHQHGRIDIDGRCSRRDLGFRHLEEFLFATPREELPYPCIAAVQQFPDDEYHVNYPI